MKNRFFDLALSVAARYTGRPGRLVALAAKSMAAWRQADRRNWTLGSVREQVFQFGRLLTAYAQGEYRRVPARALLTLTAALIYFLNPLDLIPDALPALGLTDDFAVLTWVCQSMATEMGAFLEWEKSR